MIDETKKNRSIKTMSQKIDMPLNNIFNVICEEYDLKKIDLITYLFDYSTKYLVDMNFLNKYIKQIKIASVKFNIETVGINIEKDTHPKMKKHLLSIKKETNIRLTMEQYIRLLSLWFLFKSGFNEELNSYLAFLTEKSLNPLVKLEKKKSINGDSYSSIFNSLVSVKNEFELIAKKASEADSYEEANLLSVKVANALEKFVDLIPLMVGEDKSKTFKPECLEIKSLYTTIKKQFIKYRIVV